MTKEKLVEIIKDNFTNDEGIVDISGMDFGECSVDISSLKTEKTLWQHSQDVNEHLYQNAQKVGQDLFQDSQEVGSDLVQNYQTVGGNLWEGIEEVGGKILRHY